jgi:type II secretory pathway component GspD/PulD (secretin)
MVGNFRNNIGFLLPALVWLNAPDLLAHEWRDASGKFKVEAIFVRFVGDEVELKKSDGRLIKVPVAKLCEDDQTYLKTLRKKSGSESTETFSATINERYRINSEGMQLTEFLKALQDEYAMSVYVMPAVSGRTLEGKVTTTVKNGSLKNAMSKILQPFELTWFEIDQTLVIGMKQDADRVFVTRVYRIKKSTSVKDIQRELKSSIAPDTWQENGGAGLMLPFRNDSFVISQSYAIHQEIDERFSGKLVCVRGQVKLDDNEKILHRFGNVQYSAITLENAIKELGKQFGIPILIDQKALVSVGVTLDTPVTLELRDAKFSTILNLMLEPLELISELQRDGSMKITSQRAGRGVVRSQSYEVLNLVSKQTVNGVKVIDSSSLIQIVQAIDPSSWQSSGGFGMARYNPSGQLEISQNEINHKLLRQLFADLIQSTKK